MYHVPGTKHGSTSTSLCVPVMSQYHHVAEAHLLAYLSSRHCQMVTWAHFHAYRDLCRSHSGTPSYMLAGSQHYHTGVWSTCSCICHIPVSSCCGTPSYSSAVSKCCHMVQPGLFMHAVSPYTLVVSQCRHMVAWALLSVHVPCPALPCGSLGPHCPCTCCTWCQHVAA